MWRAWAFTVYYPDCFNDKKYARLGTLLEFEHLPEGLRNATVHWLLPDGKVKLGTPLDDILNNWRKMPRVGRPMPKVVREAPPLHQELNQGRIPDAVTADDVPDF